MVRYLVRDYIRGYMEISCSKVRSVTSVFIGRRRRRWCLDVMRELYNALALAPLAADFVTGRVLVVVCRVVSC